MTQETPKSWERTWEEVLRLATLYQRDTGLGMFWLEQAEKYPISDIFHQEKTKLLRRVEEASDNCKYGHKFDPTCERCVARTEMRGDIENSINLEEPTV